MSKHYIAKAWKVELPDEGTEEFEDLAEVVLSDLLRQGYAATENDDLKFLMCEYLAEDPSRSGNFEGVSIKETEVAGEFYFEDI